MSWLAPLGLLAALSLPLIVVLHMRHSRSRPLPVTTMRFWAEATRHRRQRLAWRRPPWSLLLALQLLAAALIILALLRPALPLPGLPGNSPPRQLILLLDRSMSMRATDLAPSRYEVAKGRARDLIRGAATEEAVTLLTLGADSRTLRARDAGDREALLAALDALGPSGGQADLNGLLATLRATILPERENRIVLLSAGVFADPPDRAALAALPATLSWERIGGPIDNLAVTTLVTRRSPPGGGRLELFARVANYATTPATAWSQIEADGALVDNRLVTVPASGTTELVWQLPTETRGAHLRVTPASGAVDALALDNEAWVVTREVAQRRVLLVSETPGDLGRALAAQAGVVLNTVAPGAYSARQEYDLTVFDGFEPGTLPRGGVLLVNPPPTSTIMPRTGSAETPVIAHLDREHPILAGIDLGGLTFTTTPIYSLPSWATEIAGSRQGPLIIAGNRDGREIVALGLDPVATGLSKKLAFPLLIGNIVDRLQTHRIPASAALGAGVLLEPVAGTQSALLRDPAGTNRTLELRESPGGAPAVYAVPDRPGLYALIERDATGTTLLQESFAVNAGDATASNLRNVAVDLPSGRGGVAPPATAATQPATAAPAARRLGELWPIVIALALLVLLIEWIAGQGRTRAPRRQEERVRPRAGLAGAPRR